MKTISKKRQEMGEQAWAEHRRLKANEKAERYRAKNGYHVVNWRRRTKLKLIEYKGGKCEKCGYDKPCPSAYDFHHKDPATKEFGIGAGGVTLSFEKLKAEADKCQLLCRNCHAETHDAAFATERARALAEHEAFMAKRIERRTVKCPSCKVYFMQVWANQTFCCETCASMDRRKVDRPSKEELEAMVSAGLAWVEIARRFLVTDNAVRRWAVSYGIPIPPRRPRRT